MQDALRYSKRTVRRLWSGPSVPPFPEWHGLSTIITTLTDVYENVSLFIPKNTYKSGYPLYLQRLGRAIFEKWHDFWNGDLRVPLTTDLRDDIAVASKPANRILLDLQPTKGYT